MRRDARPSVRALWPALLKALLKAVLTAMRSASVRMRLDSPAGVSTAMCSTVVAASEPPLPTTSMVTGSRSCVRTTERIQGGCVAEKSTVWREGGVASRIVSTSSLNPMLSISSASSSTA